MTGMADEMSREVLTKANEDYSGLYEVVWSFRTNFMPHATEPELIEAATKAVQSQLEQRNIRLIRFRMKPSPEVQDVPEAEIPGILGSRDSWQPPKSWEDWYPSFYATDEGERAWRISRKSEV
jgi:hypothetical protein